MNPQHEFYCKAWLQQGQDDTSIERLRLAEEIAATARIGKNRTGYIVPAQTGSGSYLVRLDGELSCTCSDFELRLAPCKHILAVALLIQSRDAPGGLTTRHSKSRKLSHSRDWSAYNHAQANEKKHFPGLLRELCNFVPQQPQITGRPRRSLGDQVYTAASKVYNVTSGRRALTEISDAHARGHLQKTPTVASVFRSVENPALTDVLEDLISRSALPLRSVERDFAIDASGFSSSVKETWYDHKWVKPSEKTLWVKAHVCCGVQTNIVTAAIATPGTENDSPFFIPLLKATAENFSIDEVSADKAYLGKKNLRAIEAVGANRAHSFQIQFGAIRPETAARHCVGEKFQIFPRAPQRVPGGVPQEVERRDRLFDDQGPIWGIGTFQDRNR